MSEVVSLLPLTLVSRCTSVSIDERTAGESSAKSRGGSNVGRKSH